MEILQKQFASQNTNNLWLSCCDSVAVLLSWSTRGMWENHGFSNKTTRQNQLRQRSRMQKIKKVYIRVMIYPYSHPNMMIYHHHIDPRNICPSYIASSTIPSAYLVVTLSNPWPPPIQNLQEKGYAAESQRLMYFGGELEETRTVSQDFELDLRPLPWTKKQPIHCFLMSLTVFCRWVEGFPTRNLVQRYLVRVLKDSRTLESAGMCNTATWREIGRANHFW